MIWAFGKHRPGKNVPDGMYRLPTGIVLRLPAYLPAADDADPLPAPEKHPPKFSITSLLVNRLVAVWRYHFPDFRVAGSTADGAISP